MKMTAETYALCLARMKERTKLHGGKEELSIKIKAHRKALHETVEGDSTKLFTWNLIYCLLGAAWVCDNLYKVDLNDDHIFTAAKKLFNEYFETDDYNKFFSE